MKRKRFSVEQVVSILKQAELGTSMADLIHKVGIMEQIFYGWKKQRNPIREQREFSLGGAIRSLNEKGRNTLPDFSVPSSDALMGRIPVFP